MAAKKTNAKPILASKAVLSKTKLEVAPARPRAALRKPTAAEAEAKPKAKLSPAQTVSTLGPSLDVGSRAPAFVLPDESGAQVSSTALAGKPYLIYFYPKDDTPGCTKEACDFRDNLRAFDKQKVRVFGVSPDDPKRHAKFKEKYGLNFSLLSDVDKTLIGAYGVWVNKLNYGRAYMGVQRSTFLVDKAGKIAFAWKGVRVPGHVEAVLAALATQAAGGG